MNDARIVLNRRLLLQGAVAAALAASLPARAQSDEAATGGAGEISPLMRTLSAYIAGANKQALPDAVTEAAKQHTLDSMGAMISGSRLLPGVKVIGYVKRLGGTPEACVPGTRIITNVLNAALAGGMMAHADETDDSNPRATLHPGAVVVPPTLAMAEYHGRDGTQLLRAVALGYDIGVRASFALGAGKFRAAGLDTYGYAGPFAAAAAAAAIAGLNADQVRFVLSYAAQQSSGFPDYPRDTQHIEKAFNFAGRGARSGVSAVTMVAAGMTGVEDAFSGDNNFFAAYKATAKPDEFVRDLGKTYAVAETTIKKWSVGTPAQAPLDSVLELIKTNNVKPADVEKIVIRLEVEGAKTVNNRSMSDINLQYLTAVMLIDRTLTFAAAHDIKRMDDPQVLDLRRRVELIGDEEITRARPERHAIVQMKLRDGRELNHKTTQVRGTIFNPMTRDEVGAKALDLMGPILGKARTRELIDTVWNIEKVKNVRALRRLLMA